MSCAPAGKSPLPLIGRRPLYVRNLDAVLASAHAHLRDDPRRAGLAVMRLNNLRS
ncbi:hypothetical protein [Streptomyces sp. NPDC005262]|uniref:hypothetical protein n=1 Tax=Streptomyces sp. NPDC005262 TaxID=3364710 RepID=UPI0036C42834